MNTEMIVETAHGTLAGTISFVMPRRLRLAAQDLLRRHVRSGAGPDQLRGYFAFLRGKRVTYLGRTGDQHTEWFPGAAPD